MYIKNKPEGIIMKECKYATLLTPQSSELSFGTIHYNTKIVVAQSDRESQNVRV